MKRRGITQQELSRKIGINQPTISHWFNGQEPYSKALHKLSQFFDVPIKWLKSDEESELKFEENLSDLKNLKEYLVYAKLRLHISAELISEIAEYGDVFGDSNAKEAAKSLALLHLKLSTQEIKYEKD